MLNAPSIQALWFLKERHLTKPESGRGTEKALRAEFEESTGISQ